MWPGRLLLATAGAASLLYPVSAFAAPLSQHKAHLLFGNTHPATAQYHVAARTAARARGSSSSSTAQQNGLHMSLLGFRGGAMTASAAATSKLASLTETPSALFNTALISLAFVTTVFKVLQRTPSSSDNSTQGIENKKPASVKSLQTRFLTVFWLLRCADWLQGPYFYQVYASKIFNGVPASLDLVSKLFLTGFASTALLGPFVGRAADTYGRKKEPSPFASCTPLVPPVPKVLSWSCYSSEGFLAELEPAFCSVHRKLGWWENLKKVGMIQMASTWEKPLVW